jgi:DNA-binding NtrC family response regulator
MQIGVETARAVETKRAFILDQDDVSATALQFMLADELEVHVFTSSAEALRHPAADRIDVVLLGASLIEAETADVVDRLLQAWPGVPLLAYGPAGDASVQAALARGARSSIERPFKLETVRRKVNAQIGRRAVLDIAVARG